MLIGRRIVITAFIEKLNGWSQRQKSVRESVGDADLILRARGKANRRPLAEMRRADANFHSHIQCFALDDSAKLCLRMRKLIVEAAEGPEGGNGVVVLKKTFADSEVGELGLMVSFDEGAPRVPVNYGTELIDTRKKVSSLSICSAIEKHLAACVKHEVGQLRKVTHADL
jgi:hypothetical protein